MITKYCDLRPKTFLLNNDYNNGEYVKNYES